MRRAGPICHESLTVIWSLASASGRAASAPCRLANAGPRPLNGGGVVGRRLLTSVHGTDMGPIMVVKRWVSFAGAQTLAGLLLLSQLGCERKTLTIAEADIVLTFKDEGRDYSEYKTYLLPDKVVDLCPTEDGAEGSGDIGGGGLGGALPGIDPDRCTEASHLLDDELLDAIRENMDELGYTEVTDPEEETPDVALFVGVVAQNNWFSTTTPGYCYPYYYYYYGCWYPGYTYTYELQTDAYVVDMADVSESTKGDLSSVWTAMIQGLHEQSSEKTGKQRVQEAIDQAFKQSKYLAEGGN